MPDGPLPSSPATRSARSPWRWALFGWLFLGAALRTRQALDLERLGLWTVPASAHTA